MKIGEIAKRLGVTTDVVRYAANTYSEQLSASAGGQVKGATRQFSDHDCQVIASILYWRDQGLPPDDIIGMLLTADLQPCPEPPDPAAEHARQSVALVAQPEYARALDKIQELQADLVAARQERSAALETWQTDVTRLNDRIADLEHKLGSAEGELESLKAVYQPPEYWLTRERNAARFWLLIVGIAVVLTAALLIFALTRLP